MARKFHLPVHSTPNPQTPTRAFIPESHFHPNPHRVHLIPDITIIVTWVRVFIFLLSGLFCCLGFSGVVFFAVWSGACSFFCCLGGGPGPAQTAKKMTRPRPNSKKKKTPPPLPDVFFCCLGGWVCLFFAVWAGERVLFVAV